MESILSILINADNVRMLVQLAFVTCAYVFLRSQMKDMGHFLNKRIDGLDHKIDMVEASLNKRIDGVEASLNKRIDGVEASLNKRMDGVERRMDGLEASIKELKYNDFAHLNATIEALTFTLEKNNFLKHEDKEYVDTRLAR